jgi:hypothetical protein
VANQAGEQGVESVRIVAGRETEAGGLRRLPSGFATGRGACGDKATRAGAKAKAKARSGASCGRGQSEPT